MDSFRKKIYVAAGYNTIYMGAGRKEFNPKAPMMPFESYLQETAEGTCRQLKQQVIDEGVLGSFMPARFINQANLPGFLPFMVPSLEGKTCTGVEGACGTGGRAIATGLRSLLSDLASTVFIAGFEIQNTVKAVYGADILAGAAHYSKERKGGHAYFFPGIFAERANHYYNKYGYNYVRRGMAKWYENAITNARKNPKAQEYHNKNEDLFALGMTPPDPKRFVPYLNHYDCSKISDGASSLMLFTEKGLEACGIEKTDAVEIVGMGEAQGDITKPPLDPLVLSTTEQAVVKALRQAGLSMHDIGVLEVHDCFSISGLLSLEATGLVARGDAPQFVMDGQTTIGGKIPTNLSGGLGGFGHPTGATGVRQMVDLLHQMTNCASNQAKLSKPHGMMISMGGNDKTVTCFIVKSGAAG